MAIFVAILLSNCQKSCFICLSSALLSQSINICTCHVYRCLSKAPTRHSRFTTIHPDSSKTVNRGSLGLKSSILNSCVSRCSEIRYLQDISTAPLRFMTAALRFTTVELQMLTVRRRFAAVLVLFRPVVPRHSPHAVFSVMNRSESECQ